MSEVQNNPKNAPSPSPPSTPQFAAATQPSYLHTLFLGANGLRPGWGFAFYVATFYALQWLAFQLVSMQEFGAGRLWSSLLEELLEEFGNLLAAMIPAVILARIEGRRWGSYGLPTRHALARRFWAGVLWGSAAISFLMFSLHVLHCFAFGPVVLHGARVARFACFWAVMFLLVALFEDFLFRGYTQFTLARGIGFWPAAIVLTCSFGLIHLRNEGEHWSGILAAAFIGFFFCFTLWRTGNLWFAIGFHAAWDWGETFFYSVPDSGMVSPGHLLSSSLRGPDWLSGGSVGPEGSVLCFVVIGLIWALFGRVYRRAVS